MWFSSRLERNVADVEEVVGVTEVFTEPLQRCVMRHLNALDHYTVTCTRKKSLSLRKIFLHNWWSAKHMEHLGGEILRYLMNEYPYLSNYSTYSTNK